MDEGLEAAGLVASDVGEEPLLLLLLLLVTERLAVASEHEVAPVDVVVVPEAHTRHVPPADMGL